MVEYSISVKIANTYVTQFSNEAWKLCFAFGLSDGGGDPVQYNLVANVNSTQSPMNLGAHFRLLTTPSRRSKQHNSLGRRILHIRKRKPVQRWR